MRYGKFSELDSSLKSLNLIEGYLVDNANMRSHLLSKKDIGECLIIENGVVAVAITSCKVDHHVENVLKIEDLVISEAQRGKGYGTSLLNVIKQVADKTGTIVGLWAEEDKLDFYKKRGFKLVTKKRDYWLEYTPNHI